MRSNPPANTPPPKLGEQDGSSSGPIPFKPPSSGNTSVVVEASGTAKPGEVVTTANRNPVVNINTLGRPLPSRPWEQQNYGSSNTYGGYGSNIGYNSSYGSGMYGGYGGTSYGGGGLYGNSMYRGGYDGGMVGGSGMYNGGIGGQMVGGYGMGIVVNGLRRGYGERD